MPADNQTKPTKPDKKTDRSSVKLSVALAGPTIEMKFNMGLYPPFTTFLLFSLRVLSRKYAERVPLTTRIFAGKDLLFC